MYDILLTGEHYDRARRLQEKMESSLDDAKDRVKDLGIA